MAIWWVVFAVHIAVSVPGLVGAVREAGGALFGALLGVVVVLAWSALFVWLAYRMGRGGPNARMWLAIFAGLSAVSFGIALLTAPPTWGALEPVALIVAAVLSYLPSARGWFPKAERRPRRVEPKTLGWDPETGERITEDTER
ncbi:hypothetical protein ASG04_02890 [Curtobacterium sp. Leaf183]|nr:hypothetical protein ASG04_02890 [Curtobacterium sp. Leaf183]